MKKSKFNLGLFASITLLCFIFSCEQQAEKVNVEADITEIKEVLKQYAVACNAGDFESWISLWDDDGVQMPPDTPPLKGKTQIIEGNKPSFDQMIVDITINSIEEVKVHGDWGLTRCTYTLAVSPKEGGETIIVMPDGKALTLYERQSDGSWKITYDCFNSNLPPKQE